jgi:hypothetical protein
VYDMVTVPAETALSKPVALPIEAMAGVADDHVPPVVPVVDMASVAPWHIAAAVVMVPALGSAFTLTTLVAAPAPQALDTE